ncbi:glycosyltransferase [Clostridium intestinale]|uniref:glycosyltransferase family 4 protein n=1 Tax=Clostridium intestinale TaxID=36845 RepID=UPI002DD68185|nr:glycosyltransferase [Clostridium intestinale]WRY49806.1 glycosyltransferase [Clostridium intestinale]
MKTWYTLFPDAMNYHLTKDVGYIPYLMHKNYGIESRIICYETDKYDYLDNEVKGLKLEKLKKISNNKNLDSIIYLFLNSKKIDILNLYHFRKIHLVYVLVYKLLRPNGKVFMKLDANESIRNSKIGFLSNKILKKIDLISVETIALHSWLNNNWPVKVEYIPNGFIKQDKEINTKNKKNIILFVGRVGAPEKQNEILLNAFCSIYKQIPGWKLKFVGPITKEFVEEVNKKISDNSEMSKYIEVSGEVNEKQKLSDIYNEAKVFCITSKYESFCLALAEAIGSGCYVITSNILSASDITNNGEYGKVIDDINDSNLAEALLSVCNSNTINYNLNNNIIKYANDNFSWDSLCKKIYKFLY